MQSSNFVSVFTKSAIQSLCASLLFVSMSAQSVVYGPEDYFVTTWKTDNPGASNNTSITVPMIGGLYKVDWDNDGVFDEYGLTGSSSHDFGVAGTYTIRIEPGFDTIKMFESGEEEKLISVDQWGSTSWTSMQSAFAGTSNLSIKATDIPQLIYAGSMDLSHMFSSSGANPDVSNWDTSLVESTDHMFNGATSANPDVSGWNVTSLASAAGMFTNSNFSNSNYERLLLNWGAQTLIWYVPFSAGGATVCTNSAKLAKLDLESISYFWNISDGGEFCDPTDDFVTTWKTDNEGSSNDTSISIQMYDGQYEVDWDGNDGIADFAGPYTNSITHDFSSVGIYTIRIRAINPVKIVNFRITNPKKLLAIEQWGSIKWSSMGGAFDSASNMIVNATDIPDLSLVWEMDNMFRNATLANPNTRDWDMSNAKNIESMFEGATLANPDTSQWDTSSVEWMSWMFMGATSANPDTSQWVTSNLIGVGGMFKNAVSANPDVSNWDTSNVKEMYNTFDGAILANPDVSSWDISSLTNATGMFNGIGMSTENYENLLVSWAVQTPNSDVVFDAGKSTYCSPASIAAKNSLVNSYNWVITDLGECFVENFFSDGFE